MPAKESKKKGPTLPLKPSTVSEYQWALAHSATKLLELLAAPDSSRGSSAASKAGDNSSKPLATKQTAALWLWQLVSASADAREEAVKAGAVEICTKIAASHGCSSEAHQVLVAYCLNTLMQLAAPSAGAQSSAAVREQLLTARPLVLPALLGHLAAANSTSLTAAAVGLLAVLACSPDTHSRVKKLMAAWDKSPLISALVMQHSLPLVGGRHAAADAAAVLQAICRPNLLQQPAAAAAEDRKGGKEGKDGKEGAAGSKESSGSKGSSTAATGGGSADAAADASLTAAVQQSVLSADGLAALLQVCRKVGSPAAARSEAAAAAAHLMSAHGRQQQVKEDFKQQQGLPTMMQLMSAQQLPTPAKAAAAACIWHYLAPQPADTVGSSSSGSDASGQAPGNTAAGAPAGTMFPASGVFGLPPPAPAGILDSASACRPLTAAAVRSNLIAAAKSARRQAQQQKDAAAGGSSSSGAVQEGSMSGVNSRSPSSSASGSAGTSTASAAGVGSGNINMPAQQPEAAAAAAASYQAAVAVWQDAVEQGDLAVRAAHVIESGCVPALLLLCCGPDNAPASLVAAATAAAAAARASMHPVVVVVGADVKGTDGHADTTGTSGSAAADSASGVANTRATSGSSSARGAASWSPGDLGAIAEPSHSELDDSNTDTATAAHSAIDEEGAAAEEVEGSSRASSGRQGSGEKKKKKGGKKKAAKLEPGMAEAQCAASAAVKLLAMSGEAGRAALLAAGAKQVLVPLLAAPTAVARWNARQSLMLLSLAASDKRRAPDLGGSSSTTRAARDATSRGLAGIPAGELGQLAAAVEERVPDYIAMGNLPASHWQRSAPLTMPPLPALPVIPGKRPAGAEQQQQQGSGPAGAGAAAAGGSAGAVAGAGSSGSLSMRPGSHQQRRISMSSAAGAVMMAASRMSISNVAASNSSSNASSAASSAEGSTHVSAGGEGSNNVKQAKQGARGSVRGAGSGGGATRSS
jgi:hypothetical protein